MLLPLLAPLLLLLVSTAAISAAVCQDYAVLNPLLVCLSLIKVVFYLYVC
jgi:hypothetical protein